VVARVLAAHEWARLAETDLDLAVWGHLGPADAEIVIVEDAGVIVACWATFLVRHVEGFWVHPDHRKRGGVLRRLFVGMRKVLLDLGTRAAATQADTPEIDALLRAAGATRIPGTSFLLPVNFGPWAKGSAPCR
jgi:hypothetical protein